MTGVYYYQVEADRADQRIDNFLASHWHKVPKSRLYKAVRKGEVRVNGKRIKPEYRLQSGDKIRVPPLQKTDTPVNTAMPGQGLTHHLEQAILYEDEYLMAVNKPSGLAVHGGSGIHLGMIESYRAIRPDLKFIELVHRLDRDTSGVVLMAKKRSALKALQADFRQKTKVQKTYWCLVAGVWPDDVKQVDLPLRKNHAPDGQRFVSVTAEGKPSLTGFRVLASNDQLSWLEARPITGRTHQIRVHAQYYGHPILGDEKYQNEQAKTLSGLLGLGRLFLHATQLRVPHPADGRQLIFEAQLEPKLQAMLNDLAS